MVTPVGERPVVDVDLNGFPFTQQTLDYIWQEVAAAEQIHHRQMVDLVIRRIPSTLPLPRLIVDYNDIYEALTEILKRKKESE